MKNAALCLLFALIFCAWGHFFTEDIPLFMWSGENLIIGQNVGVSESLKSQQVFEIFQSIFNSQSKSVLSKYLTVEHSPEVFVLYLQNELRTDQLSTYSNEFSPLKELLKTQVSSLAVPFIDAQIPLDSVIISAANAAKQAGGKVFYAGEEGSSLVKELKKRDSSLLVSNLAEIETSINQNSDIFNNNKIDFIIIHLDKSRTTDPRNILQNSVSIIQNVEATISSATSNYLAAYTALAYANPGLKGYGNNHFHGAQKRGLAQSPEAIPPAPAPINHTNNTPFFFEYFGGWFWEVLLLAIVAVPIVVAAIHAIDGIQTPDRFSKIKQK